jgi:hypothetical protein
MAGLFGFVTLLFGVVVSPPPMPCATAAPTPATNTAASTKELVCIFITASFNSLLPHHNGWMQDTFPHTQ